MQIHEVFLYLQSVLPPSHTNTLQWNERISLNQFDIIYKACCTFCYSCRQCCLAVIDVTNCSNVQVRFVSWKRGFFRRRPWAGSSITQNTLAEQTTVSRLQTQPQSVNIMQYKASSCPSLYTTYYYTVLFLQQIKHPQFVTVYKHLLDLDSSYAKTY